MLKQFTRSMLWSVLGLLLGFLPLIALAQMVIYDSDKTKETLQSSGIYKEAVPSLITANTESADPALRTALADPRFQELINQAIPESYVSAEAEKNIDAFYAWLQGKTDTLAVGVDQADVSKRFEDAAVAYASERAQELPRCTSVAAAQASANQPLSATCIPAGVSATTIAEQVRSRAGAQADQSIEQQNTDAIPPEVNLARDTALKIVGLFWIVIAAIIVLGAAFVALSENHRSGVRRIGILLLITAFGLAVTTLITYFVRSGISQDLQSSAIEQALLNIVRDATTSASKLFGTWAAAYAIIGGLLVGLFRNPTSTGSNTITTAPKA